MASYGYQVTWREDRSTIETVGVSDAPSLEEARAEAITLAVVYGYRPPRWWEWWRWGEVRQPLHESVLYLHQERSRLREVCDGQEA